MSPEKYTVLQTARINARYRQNVVVGENTLCHHGDCYIYTPLQVCNCGILHDLVSLDTPEKLYPKYLDEHCGQLRALEIHRRAREFVCEIHEILRHEHAGQAQEEHVTP